MNTPRLQLLRPARLLAFAAGLPVLATGGCSDAGPKGPVATALTIDGAPVRFNLTESVQLAARVFDQNANPMADAVTTWTSTNIGIITVSPTGRITAAGPGTAIVIAVSGDAADSASIAVLAPPRTIAASAGESQSAAAGSTVAAPPAVVVRNALGGPVSGVVVAFAVESGGGTISETAVITRFDGQAILRSWTLGTAAGPNTVTASVSIPEVTGGPVRFTAQGTAGSPASIAVVNGAGQFGEQSSPLAVAPTVRVRDTHGNPVAGVGVTFAVASGGGTVTGPQSTTDASGIASAGPWTLGEAMGVQTLTATATGSGIAGNPVTFSATAVPASTLPRITSITPATLVPGSTITIDGSSFTAQLSAVRVTVGGVDAPVSSVSTTRLVATVPCVATGNQPVRVTSSGIASAPVDHPLQVSTRSLAVGEAFIGTSSALSTCTDLRTPAGNARYIVAVFSASTSANTLVDFEIAGNPVAAGAAPRAIAPASPRPLAADAEDARDRAHWEMLERNRADYERLRALDLARPAAVRSAARAATRTATQARAARAGAPPVLGEMRSIYYTFDSGCSDTTQVIRGKLVYSGTYSVIWEDSANSLQSVLHAGLATYYRRLGEIFDRDQYTSVRNTFGDPLRRDAETDADGKIHMVFTQRLNNSGAAAFVTSCDQFDRSISRGSNFGQFFYGSVPTTPTVILTSTASPDGWFYFMARTVIHEVKHIASHSARVANGAPVFESSWLEEGTARHAEEVWVRDSLHRIPWKGNTGYGSSTTNGVFCDFHPEVTACTAADPFRRPSYGMRRQFNEIREKLVEPWNWSPYGDGITQAGSVFYQTAWSLVRYTIDRYAASDASFFTALTNSMTNGVTNLAATAGQPIDRLVGGWGLSLFADDYPGLATPSADISFPTWNLRSIYAGLNTDPTWAGRWTTPYPVQPQSLSFGSFLAGQTGLRGGAHAYFEISGQSLSSQLLSIRAVGGGAPSALLRIAIARLQ